MKLTIDYSTVAGPAKAMNAANNGPVYMPAFPDADERLNNLEAYRAANIPYARTHDASFCTEYGEEHTVDTNCIFTDFDADPEDPAAYDILSPGSLRGWTTVGGRCISWTKPTI